MAPAATSNSSRPSSSGQVITNDGGRVQKLIRAFDETVLRSGCMRSSL
jgi:hypothetical protein